MPTKVDDVQKRCDVDHGHFPNFEVVMNAGYCAEKNVLHGVKCSGCKKLFVSGNKKVEGEFNKCK